MSGLWYLAITVLLVVALGLVIERLYREIFLLEGIRLGERIHTRLYDRWAASYDANKSDSQRDDAGAVAGPLIERLAAQTAAAPDTLVLDVATGTGRLPAALLGDPRYRGRIVGLDISPGMLGKAAEKLARFGDRSALLLQRAAPLPFPDGTFAAVSCLETMELLDDQAGHLREFHRVLRAGGILLVTRNTGEWGRAAAACPPETFTARLIAAGFEQVEIRPWWRRFDLVWARKPAGSVVPSPGGVLAARGRAR